MENLKESAFKFDIVQDVYKFYVINNTKHLLLWRDIEPENNTLTYIEKQSIIGRPRYNNVSVLDQFYLSTFPTKTETPPLTYKINLFDLDNKFGDGAVLFMLDNPEYEYMQHKIIEQGQDIYRTKPVLKSFFNKKFFRSAKDVDIINPIENLPPNYHKASLEKKQLLINAGILTINSSDPNFLVVISEAPTWEKDLKNIYFGNSPFWHEHIQTFISK